MRSSTIKRKPPIGSIIKIKIDNFYSFGQVLDFSSLVIFDSKGQDIQNISEILKLEILFIVAVYNDSYKNGNWELVGRAEIANSLLILPDKFIQDPIDLTKFEIYNPNTGSSKNATKEECEGLERSSVWNSMHVESRIRDFYLGNQNVYLEGMKIK